MVTTTGSLTVVSLPPVRSNTRFRQTVATAAGVVAFWWTVVSLLLISVAYNTAWYNDLTEPRPIVLALVGLACLAVIVSARPTMTSFLVALLVAGVVAVPEFQGWLDLDPAIPAVALPVTAVVMSGAFRSSRVLLRHSYWAALLVVWGSFALLLAIGLGLRASAFFTGNDRPLLGWGQFRGVLVHPNVLGAVAVMGLLIGLGLAVRNGLVWWRLLMGPGACAAALLLTGSRSSLVAAAIGIPVLLWPGVRGLAFRWCRPLAFAVPLSVAAVPLLAVQVGWYLEARLRPWAISNLAWQENRLFGYGPALMTDSFWNADGAPRYPDNWYPTHAHNSFLHAVGLGGIIAGGVLLLAIGAAVYLAATSRLSPIPLAAVLAVLVMATFDSILGRTEIPTTYLPLVLTAAVVAAAMATHRCPPESPLRAKRGKHLPPIRRAPITVADSVAPVGTAERLPLTSAVP